MLRLLVISSCVLFGAAPSTAQEATLVIENAYVIVGDGTVLERGSVILAGDRIVAVSDGQVDAPNAHRIDATGKTLLPGMIDTHVHLLIVDLQSQPRTDAELQTFVEGGLSARLEAFLETGITTVMSTGDFWPHIREIRTAIESGELLGPRVFTSGPVFTAPGGHPAAGPVCGPWGVLHREANPWCTDHIAAVVNTPSDARVAVDRLAGEGIDHVKMVFGNTDPPQVNLLEPHLVGEIVAAAHAEGLRAYAHISEIDKARTAIGVGLDGLVHIPYAASTGDEPERLADAMRREGVSVATTLIAGDLLRSQGADAGDEGMVRFFSESLSAMQSLILRVAEVDGSLIALGTDTPQLPPAEAFHREMELLIEAGLTPHQVIQTATRNAASHLGREEALGTLEAGKLADLIVVDGNPLEDLSALKNVEMVIKNGEVVVAPFPRGSGALRTRPPTGEPLTRTGDGTSGPTNPSPLDTFWTRPALQNRKPSNLSKPPNTERPRSTRENGASQTISNSPALIQRPVSCH